jgi:hypothetical protein
LRIARKILLQCSFSIDVIPLWEELWELAEPLENRDEFRAELAVGARTACRLIEQLSRQNTERDFDGLEKTINALMKDLEGWTDLTAALFLLKGLFYQSSRDDTLIRYLSDGMLSLINRMKENRSLNPETWQEVASIALYLEQTHRIVECSQIYESGMSAVIQIGNFELVAQFLRGLVTWSIATDNIELLHTTCTQISQLKDLDHRVRRYAELHLVHYAKLFRAEKELRKSESTKESDPVGYFKNVVDVALANGRLGRLTSFPTTESVALFILEAPPTVRAELLNIVSHAFARERSGSPIRQIAQTMIYPILRTQWQLPDLDMRSFSAEIEGAIRRHDERWANSFKTDAESVLLDDGESSDISDLEHQKEWLKERIVTWHNRAQVAFERGNLELSRRALSTKYESRCALAELEGNSIPEIETPESLFEQGKNVD